MATRRVQRRVEFRDTENLDRPIVLQSFLLGVLGRKWSYLYTGQHASSSRHAKSLRDLKTADARVLGALLLSSPTCGVVDRARENAKEQ